MTIRGSIARKGEGPYTHLEDDHDIRYMVRKMEVSLLYQYASRVGYGHVYIHMDNE